MGGRGDTSHPSIQKLGLEIPYLCLPGQTVPAERATVSSECQVTNVGFQL